MVGDELRQAGGEDGDGGEQQSVVKGDMAEFDHAVVDFGKCLFPRGHIAMATAEIFDFGGEFEVVEKCGVAVVYAALAHPVVDQPCDGYMVGKQALA